MFNLNRITLIGNTGAEAKTVPNGPTTLSLATNVTWTDKQTNERRTRTEWHQLVIWNGLGKWAATLPKGTPLFVEGELVYERYPRKIEAAVGMSTATLNATELLALFATGSRVTRKPNKHGRSSLPHRFGIRQSLIRRGTLPSTR